MNEVKNIEPLTGLRFICAAMIMILHSGMYFTFSNFGGSLNLDMGVDFFFILSGFIMTYKYSDMGYCDVKRFIISRFARLYPVHILTFLVYIFSDALKFPLNLPIGLVKKILVLVANALLLQSFFPFVESYFSFNAVSWSISDEMFFYIVFCCFVLGGVTKRRAILWWILLFLVSVFFFSIARVENVSFLGREGAFQFSAIGVVFINPFARVFEFFIGILICIAFRGGRSSRVDGLEDYKELFVLVFFVSSVWITARLGIFLSSNALTRAYITTYSSIIPCCLVIYLFSLARGRLSRSLLGAREMVRLGEESFVLYMLHLPILRFIQYRNLLSKS